MRRELKREGVLEYFATHPSMLGALEIKGKSQTHSN